MLRPWPSTPLVLQEKALVLCTPELPMHLPDITQKDTLSCSLPNGVVWMLQPKIKELINY